MKTTWPTKKLGEIISFEKGKKMVTTSTGEPYIGIDGLRTNLYSVYTKEKNGIRCKSDDVLLVWDGAHAGTVGTGLSGFVGSTIVKVLCDNSLNNKFLFYLLKLSQEKIRAAAQGAAIPHLNKAFINSIKIPLPPLKIQKQIVRRLDKIAEAQKLNDGLIQKSDELFRSLLHEELNPAGKKWKIKKLDEVIIETTNGFASRPVTEGVGQLRPNNIDSNGSLNFSSIKFVPKNYRNIKNYFLKKGDILFNNTNSVELVGKTAFIDADYDYVFSNHMTRIKIDKKSIEPKFLAIFLQLFYSLGKFRFLCTPWVNQAAVNTTALKRLEIPLPSMIEQQQIVAKLSAVQDYKSQLLAQKSKLKELFDSSLSKSMAGNLEN